MSDLANYNIVRVWPTNGRRGRPMYIRLEDLNDYIHDDERKSEALSEEEDSKSQEVQFDASITYKNDTATTNDYIVVMATGSEALSGVPVSHKPEIRAGDTIGYTPEIAGYYGIMYRETSVGGDYAMVDDYEIRYVQPPTPSLSPYKGCVPGWTISEYAPYYRLRLNLTDDMNSDYEFQKYLFEIMFAYVNADANGDLQIPSITEDGNYVMVKAPSLTNVRVRNTSSVLRENGEITYPFPIMIIKDTDEYSDSENNLYIRDVIQYQHRMIFPGDEFYIPKIPGQAVRGKYLVFAIRRRTIGTGMSDISSMSGPWGIAVGSSGDQIGANYRAQTDPSLEDDSDRGYSVGSKWINNITTCAYICVDDTPGKAIWTPITMGADPEMSQETVIPAGSDDPTIDVTVTKDTFREAGSEDLDNWVYQPGDTGLTVESISWTSATVVSITFAGTATAGEGVIMAIKEAFDGSRSASRPLAIRVETQ